MYIFRYNIFLYIIVIKYVFSDIEFFIPTSDTEYPQEVPSYAKPIVIRVYSSNFYQSIEEEHEDREDYKYIGEKAGRIYTIKYWDKEPEDWKKIWNKDMANEIKDSIGSNTNSSQF